MLPKKFDPDQYKSILLNRKWYAIIPLFITLAATAVYILIAPRLYQASTLILVQRQTVPEKYVSSTVTASLSERMATIKQHITSRSNLEGLIKKYDLYASKNPQDKKLTIDEKVEFMRKRIKIWVHRGAAFAIHFIDSDAEKVMRVANDLTANFINANLMVREAQSAGTTMFLQNELDRIEVDLKTREVALNAYKQKYLGGLPDQLSSNFSMLKRHSDKIVSIERSLDEARTQKIMLQGQISNLKSMSEAVQVDQTDNSVESSQGTFISPEITELRQRLETLRLRYTEKHPDIIKLKRMIAKVEADGTHTDEEAPSVGGDIFAGQVEALSFQMASIEETIKGHRQEKAKLEKQVAILTKRIEDTPTIQLELINLQRDYTAIRKQYNALLAKKLQSELAENMEILQKGEQFKIIDQAKLPEKPFKPNVRKLLLAGILGGLIAGFGLALGVEYLDKSFLDYREVSEFLQLPLLAVIPRIETADDLIKRKRLRMVAYCLSGCFLVAFCIGVWLWVNGNLQEWAEKVRTLV